jgi:formiminotetrahydrofolate cyclodeaminase
LLTELSVQEFLGKVTAKDPVPGGGSVSALAGAAAAALAAMVASLTIGREKFVGVEEKMQAIKQAAEGLRTELLADVDRDAEAYDQVVRAFKLPKKTEAEQQARTLGIQAAFQQAARVPLGVAENALALMDLAGQAVADGNPNALSDGLVGTMMARTAALGALYNVKINLSSIKDDVFVRQTAERVKALTAQVVEQERKILASVDL